MSKKVIKFEVAIEYEQEDSTHVIKPWFAAMKLEEAIEHMRQESSLTTDVEDLSANWVKVELLADRLESKEVQGGKF